MKIASVSYTLSFMFVLLADAAVDPSGAKINQSKYVRGGG